MNTVTINGREFHYRDRIGDKGTIQQVFSRLDYDLGQMPLTPALVGYMTRQKKPPLIIDAGAHIGCATVWFKNQFPHSRIVAVEPELDNFTILSSNVSGIEGVSTVQGAVASYSGTAHCSDPGRDTWGYRVNTEESENSRVVKAHTMRALMQMEPDATPLIAKIDIEGSEAELFARNSAWVGLFPLIIIELHDWMLPGKAVSRNFWLSMGLNNFDVLMHGENVFAFNNALLGAK